MHAAARNTQVGWHGSTAEDAAAAGRARTVHKAVDMLEAAASTLNLPASAVTEASQLLREVSASGMHIEHDS